MRACAFRDRELLVNTRAVASLPREGKTEQLDSSLELEGQDGRVSMNQALQRLVEKNVIEAQTAARWSIPHESRSRAR